MSGIGAAEGVCRRTRVKRTRRQVRRVQSLGGSGCGDATDVVSGKADTYDDFLEELPPADCRFAVYDFEYRNADDCVFDKLVFVLWSPDGAQLKSKMLYASTKDFFKSQLDGISLELQATDADDISEEAMRDHVASVLTRN